jgi:guanylate kinase
MTKKGILFVASGPSGTGKTTLCRLVEDRLGIAHSVSYTTRPPRGNEVDQKDYHFVTNEVFDRMIQEGAFLEWAQVHGFRYGTSRKAVEESAGLGQDLILDLDTQGALQVRSKDPHSVLIFIDASDQVLEERLGRRGTEDYDKMKKRLETAKEERRFKHLYDHVVVNADLEESYRSLADLIQKERAKRGV